MTRLSSSLALAAALFASLAGCDDTERPTATGGAGGEGEGGAGGSTHPPYHPPDGGGGEGGAMNKPPVAECGFDAVAAPGAPVELDGSGSYDPEMTELTYTWSLSGVSFEPSLDATISFAAPEHPGDYTVSLTVTDADGQSGWDQMNLHVKGPPTVGAGADRTGLAGDTVSLAGSVSENDGDVVTVAWTQVAGPPVALSDASSLTPSLVLPAGLSEPLVFQLVATDPEGTSEPDWVTVVELDGPDSDGDLLSDAKEIALGTDPAAPDTDADGIPDGWEIGLHDLVDYAALGCSPLHRDILVEVDYQPEVEPGPTLLAAWVAHYAGQPVSNPDGITGFAAHFVLDSVLPDDFACGNVFSFGDTDDNPLYREAFHTLAICDGGGEGVSELTGKHSYISAPPADADLANDLDEPAVYLFYWLGLHELGHSLGLHHGGVDPINYKPNYPSYMNYYFDDTLQGGATSIATSDVALSSGLRPVLDECAVKEAAAWAGVPGAETSFLASYSPMGWSVAANGDIDWDRDGAIETATYELVLRSLTGDFSGDYPDCQLLIDTDDVALIAASMADALASNPSPGPMPVRLTQREWVP